MNMSLRHSAFNILQTITLFLLFFAGLNVGNAYFYWCFIATFVFIALRRTVIVDMQTVSLLILSLSWFLFSPDMETVSLTAIIKPFLYPMAYVAGRSFFMGSDQLHYDRKQKMVMPIFVVLSLGPFLHYFLNYLKNWDSINRNTVDIWTGTVLSATNQAALGCMMLGIALSLLFLDIPKYMKALSIGSLIIIFLYNLILSGRTLFIMAALIILACIVYNFVTTRSVGQKFKIISLVLILGVVFYFIYIYNLLGIKTYIEKSNIYLRFLNKRDEYIYTSERVQFKIDYLKNFMFGLWGRCRIKAIVGRYAHDLFLDTYDEAGIFALIGVLYFMIRSVRTLLKCLRNDTIDFKIRLTMLAVYISLYSEFLIEPILQGVPWLFMLFCFIHGIMENICGDFDSGERKDVHKME